jgi:hypothetical protein
MLQQINQHNSPHNKPVKSFWQLQTNLFIVLGRTWRSVCLVTMIL